ncbi:protein of unknown function (plasmid) [Methylocella tundrae]|uniref:Uncharacterized protein n=1 Tax=Methylocella tundrae TaxID=227605 RepID=A0A4U8Z6V6_METTU|nr:protein of unknown function [Methylocella tundrae]
MLGLKSQILAQTLTAMGVSRMGRQT